VRIGRGTIRGWILRPERGLLDPPPTNGAAMNPLLAFLLLLLSQSPPSEPRQDPTLDNLVHAEGYVAAKPDTLGAVVERGKGPIDMVLVSGFGCGASVFEGFMRRNAERYHMLAVTLAGFEGTAAPPMPAAGTSYGAQTWTRGAITAVTNLIAERKL